MKKKIKKFVFILLGFICVVLAYFGIILPGVPGIPFIILGAWFFLQSSEKLYGWMIKRKFIGKVIEKYFSNEKSSIKTKIFIILQLWISLFIAQYFFVDDIYYIIILNILGVIGSLLLFFIL